MARQTKIQVGDVFGKLTIISRTPKGTKFTKEDKDVSNSYWRCKCQCGNVIDMRATTLRTSTSLIRSCGCSRETNPYYIPKAMTAEEVSAWNELYDFVKYKIFNFDDDQALSQETVLRLKGLTENKYISNNKIANTANYSYAVILNTFKYCFLDITKALKTHSFKNDTHKINYIIKIVEPNINTVYMRMKQAEINKKSFEKSEDASTFRDYESRFVATPSKKGKYNYDDMW